MNQTKYIEDPYELYQINFMKSTWIGEAIEQSLSDNIWNNNQGL